MVGVPQLRLGDGRSTAGLLVFDLLGGGPPVPLAWPEGIGARPFDLAATAGGGVVVLDVADPDAPGPARLWELDENFELLDISGEPPSAATPATFDPVETSSTALSPEPAASTAVARAVPLHEATPAAALELFVGWATAVDSLPDGSVLVLDRQGSEGRFEVSRWRCLERRPFGLRVDEPDDPRKSFVCTDQRSNAREVLEGAVGHDFVVVPPQPGSPALARLFVVDDRGDQAFEFVVGRVRRGPGDRLPPAAALRRERSRPGFGRARTTTWGSGGTRFRSAPSAGSRLLPCWCSRPRTRAPGDSTAACRAPCGTGSCSTP